MQAELAERSGQMVIETEGLTKGYGGHPVVADLSMRIMRRDRVGLVGPNGSGKTTLLRLLVGELAPDAGQRAARRQSCRSPTSISSANSSIRNGRWWTPWPTDTTR